MKKCLSFIWQLPQNILAIILMALFMKRADEDGLCQLKTMKEGWTAISLGWYILYMGDITTKGIKHEQGHQKQSMYLGWLYLVVVGIPSFFLAVYKRLLKKSDIWYHRNYPENWADKLGGVEWY